MDDYRTKLLLALRKGGKAKKGKKKDSGIHINPKNEGTFTKSAQRAGMGVQEYAAHVLAHKEDYDALTIRRANFARNAKRWKHELGGGIWSLAIGGDAPESEQESLAGLSWKDLSTKIGTNNEEINGAISSTFLNSPGYSTSYMDFSDYETPSGRELNRENLGKIDRMLADEGFGIAQRSAILGTILHESGGDPSKVDDSGNFFGLVQWSRDRLPESLGIDNSLEGQVKHLISEIRNAPSGSWTSGAAGGDVVHYGNEGRWNFFNTDDPEEAAFYLNKCFIRPWASDAKTDHTQTRIQTYKNRGSDARLIYDTIMKAEDARIRREEREDERERLRGSMENLQGVLDKKLASELDRQPDSTLNLTNRPALAAQQGSGSRKGIFNWPWHSKAGGGQ